MERRGFLQGLFGGITAAGLIVAAKPHEIEAFAKPLTNGTPLVLDKPAVQPVESGAHLYNAKGEVVAIVTAIHCEPEIISVTEFGATSRAYAAGFHDVRIEAVALGPVTWTPDGPSFSPSRRR